VPSFGEEECDTNLNRRWKTKETFWKTFFVPSELRQEHWNMFFKSVQERTCDGDIEGSNPGRNYYAPRPTQPSIPHGVG